MGVTKRFCPRGHDTEIVGRWSSTCRECKREATREYHRSEAYRERLRAKRIRLNEDGDPILGRLPIEPLRELLIRAVPRYAAEAPRHGASKGHNAMARAYAARWGENPEWAQRALSRMIHDKRQKTVEFDTADKWCCFLGYHVDLLWPQNEMVG